MQSSNNTVPWKGSLNKETKKTGLTFQHHDMGQSCTWEPHPEEEISLYNAFKSHPKLQGYKTQNPVGKGSD